MLEENKYKASSKWVMGHSDDAKSCVVAYTSEMKANIICDALSKLIPCHTRRSSPRTKQRKGDLGFRVEINGRLINGNIRKVLMSEKGEKEVAEHLGFNKWGIKWEEYEKLVDREA